jgi:hypothetical protein
LANDHDFERAKERGAAFARAQSLAAQVQERLNAASLVIAKAGAEGATWSGRTSLFMKKQLRLRGPCNTAKRST